MPRISESARLERIAMRQARLEVRPLREQLGQYRVRIAELERTVQALQAEVARLRARATARKSRGGAAALPFRFSRRGIIAHRERLGITQQQYALLVGVSSSCMCLWETGRTTPQRRRWAALERVSRMGRRAALRELRLLGA